MSERADGRIGVPGTRRPGPVSPRPDSPEAATPEAAAPGADVSEREAPLVGVPGASQSAETDRLLRSVEDDLSTMDGLDTPDQVPVYDRIHSALAEALARTADTGGPPAPGEPRA
jgi:hypothetical protein